jgi:isopentenyldiphosphate isomerase
MSEEYFDIYNESMEYIGTELRSEVHKKGYWHKSFQCWFVFREDNKQYILFQKRHPDKDIYPNLLDTTAAGHFKAGEVLVDGIREVEEELGVNVNFDDLFSVGIIKEEKVEEEFIDLEFGNVFLYYSKVPMENFKLQTEEVTGIFKMDLEDIPRLFDKKLQYVNIEGYELGSKGEYHKIKLRVTEKDLVPHGLTYYYKIYNASKKYLTAADN